MANPVAIFSRQAGLTMIFAYNSSDWSNGWNHFLDGGTLFLTPEFESTLDQDDSISLNPNETPMVTVRKRISLRLGHPYGNCRARQPSGLSHFDIYTKKQCMQQCLIDKIERKCFCSSILFPLHRNESKRLPACKYSSLSSDFQGVKFT